MQLLIDERLAEKVIPANDSVRLLDLIVEEMNLSELDRTYDVRGQKPATEPSIMLKILLYANMDYICSSKRLQASCQRDINYIWLLNGAPAPSYHEIARFRSQRLSQCVEELFFQLVEKLSDYGVIKIDSYLSIQSRNMLKLSFHKISHPASLKLRFRQGVFRLSLV